MTTGTTPCATDRESGTEAPGVGSRVVAARATSDATDGQPDRSRPKPAKRIIALAGLIPVVAALPACTTGPGQSNVPAHTQAPTTSAPASPQTKTDAPPTKADNRTGGKASTVVTYTVNQDGTVRLESVVCASTSDGGTIFVSASHLTTDEQLVEQLLNWPGIDVTIAPPQVGVSPDDGGFATNTTSDVRVSKIGSTWQVTVNGQTFSSTDLSCQTLPTTPTP